MMKENSDPRHLARIVAIQKMFERQFISGDISKGYDKEYSKTDLAEIDEFEKVDEKLLEKLLDGAEKSRDEADEIIKKYASQWPLEQIPKVDLQILRLAIYEGFIGEVTPRKVAVDEAIELAKELGGPNSAKFINGVLGNLVNENRTTGSSKTK